MILGGGQHGADQKGTSFVVRGRELRFQWEVFSHVSRSAWNHQQLKALRMPTARSQEDPKSRTHNSGILSMVFSTVYYGIV